MAVRSVISQLHNHDLRPLMRVLDGNVSCQGQRLVLSEMKWYWRLGLETGMYGRVGYSGAVNLMGGEMPKTVTRRGTQVGESSAVGYLKMFLLIDCCTAAILQQTAEYIYQLEQEKTRLLSQNCQLKRLLNQQQHHADVEGSPTGGESPCDDGGSSGGEAVIVSTQVDSGPATEELRREMIDLRMQLDRERRHRMTLEEHIRSVLGTALGAAGIGGSVAGQVTNIVEVSTTPRALTTTTIKTEPQSPHQPPHHHHQLLPAGATTTVTSTPVAAIAATTTTSSVPSMTTITTSVGQHPPRQPATAVLSRQSLTPNSHNQIPATVVSGSPATTIVTVVPSSKGGVDALPSVFEALTASGRFGAKVEVEPAPRVPSPEATIEYKSLDTICEAIRHLEGDHMFQTEDQHPRIEEEIITEETLTIEDHTGDQVTLSGEHVPVTLGGQVTLGSGQVTLAGEDEPITLHMVGEPQEVPLELTTTHRPAQHVSNLTNVSRLSQQPTINLTTNSRLAQHPANNISNLSTRVNQQSPNHTSLSIEAVPVSISTSISSHPSSSSNLLQATRPGVIVVKHP
ncbi:Transcription factor AP-4-like [Homarus americanus]|uniref:Transcription factor AP-4-like n=1 Tax=Homarus americanus TaxID=6706 RepID=A0A8J5JKD0_HOMAM|nr:Transcription factor AP-4-like [Homarus americanus]